MESREEFAGLDSPPGAGVGAPVYLVPSRAVVAFEHPCIIHNLDNGFKTFGANPNFRPVRSLCVAPANS